MPMSNDAKIEIVQRLLTAHKKTQELLEMEPVTRELHHGTDIARNWTAITACYSGVEQTLKFLIADEKGLTIEELISIVDPENNSRNNGNAKKFPYRTHNLGWLFSSLEVSTQDVVRDFYSRFRSLHSYLNVRPVDQFLNTVSGRKGAGYERWRYTLIEDKQLPRNSPEALLAIWGVCVEIAEERVWETQMVRMPDKVLAHELCEHLERLHQNVSIERQNAGEPFQDISSEIRDWLWRGGHPLNAFAGVLWHFARYGSHGVENPSEWLSDTLTQWAKNIVESPAISRQTLLRAFVTRAQGNTSSGASIRWNPKKKRFESVRWSLKKRTSDTLPPKANVIAYFNGRRTLLAGLWVAAKECGYKVLENRSFNGPPDQDDWFCTLEVRVEDAGKKKPILSIWEKRNNYRRVFYLIEECNPEETCQPVRRWIDLARKLGEMRANGRGDDGRWRI